MKRLSWLGLLPILPLAALAYACSSSDGDGDDPGVTPGDDSGSVNPGEDGGITPVDDSGNPINEGGGGGGDAGPNCNPVAPLTFTPHFVAGEWVEGARWNKDISSLVFSASFRDPYEIATIKVDPGAAPALLRKGPAGGVQGLGNAIAPDGVMWTAEVKPGAAGGLRLTPKQGGDAGATEGTPFVPAAGSDVLNSPNEIVVSSKGIVYLTDPSFQFQAEGVPTGIYRIGADKKIVAVEKFTVNNEKAEGIALAPKEDALYVSLSVEKKLRKYVVNADGTTGAGADLSPTEGQGVALTTDEAGNIYLASDVGIEVFDSAGKKLGKLTVPNANGAPTGVSFAGADKKTLIVTTGDFAGKGAVYRAPSTCVGRW